MISLGANRRLMARIRRVHVVSNESEKNNEINGVKDAFQFEGIQLSG